MVIGGSANDLLELEGDQTFGGETFIPDSLLKISTRAVESNYRNFDKKSQGRPSR